MLFFFLNMRRIILIHHNHKQIIMKHFKNIIILLIALFGINFFGYSQNTNKISHQDSVALALKNSVMKDSVKVPFVYVKTANKAFIEVKSWRKVAGLNQAELHSKDIEIAYYKYADKKCEDAYDTLTIITLPAFKKESADNAQLYQDFKSAYKLEKGKVIGLSVSVPVAILVGFLTGFLLFHK